MKNVKVSRKISMLVTLSAFLSSIAVGIIAINISEEALIESSASKLEGFVGGRTATLSNYLESISADLAFVSTNFETIQSVKDFKYGWDSIEGNSEKILKRLYITDNPYPTGQKENLDRANDESIYSEVHKEHHPWFRQFLRSRGYYDISLFDMHGNLTYTVFKESDFATNLKYGKYKDTDLGNAYRAAAAESAKQGDQFFFDFKPYTPSAGAPAAFISTPVFEKNKKIGVLVYQIPIDKINDVVASYEGMGETGETYLVGADHLMRSNSRFIGEGESSILKTEVKGATVDKALAGGTGVEIIKDYRGVNVFSAYGPIDFKGTRWVMLAEQDEEEMMRPIWDMEMKIVTIGFATLLVLTAIGYFVARKITVPLVKVNASLGELADGKNDIDIDYTDRGDEIGDLAKSALIFKQNAQEKANLEQRQKEAEARAEQEKKEAMVNLANSFEERVKGIIDNVSQAASHLSNTSKNMSETVGHSSAVADKAADSASSASSNVQAVAAATEEMSNSIQEISSQIQNSNNLVSSSVSKVEIADSHAASLDEASGRVKEVVSLISDIAGQINLLALNATIESARAGEAGKGFAVVANEVKNLAGETDKSIQEIEKVIGDMSFASENIITSLNEISDSINDISSSSSSIAAAIEEQSATTNEIAGNVQSAAQGTSAITKNVEEVSSSSSEANSASQDVLTSSQQLSERAKELDEEVKKFLDEIRG